MPEQTTGPSWTPEDVERVAKAMKAEFGTAEDWDKAPDWVRVDYRKSAAAVLAALAEAGRLREPGDETQQWSIRYVSDGVVLERNFTEAGARHWVATEPDAAFELVRRWVGPWLPVEATDTPATDDHQELA